MLSDVIRDRAIGLLTTYKQESSRSHDEVIDIMDVVGWMDRKVLQQGVSLTTIKCYRRWLAAYLESECHPEASLIRNWLPPGSREHELAIDDLDSKALHTPLSVESIDTNTRNIVGIDKAACTALIDQLLSTDTKGNMRYAAGPVAALMFMSTMMTGLRPKEWAHARYLESFTDPETMITLGPVLETHTLKQTNRREDNPLREKRYLVLDRWTLDQIGTVKGLMAEVDLARGDFDSLYNKVRMTINRAWQQVVKSNPVTENGSTPNCPESAQIVSLYTGRHIFAEETRLSLQFSRFELAAMLGHSLLINQIYYGPRAKNSERSFDFVLPRPWPGDADEIKKWDRKVNPLRVKFAQGDMFSGDSAEHRDLLDGVSSFHLR